MRPSQMYSALSSSVHRASARPRPRSARGKRRAFARCAFEHLAQVVRARKSRTAWPLLPAGNPAGPAPWRRPAGHLSNTAPGPRPFQPKTPAPDGFCSRPAGRSAPPRRTGLHNSGGWPAPHPPPAAKAGNGRVGGGKFAQNMVAQRGKPGRAAFHGGGKLAQQLGGHGAGAAVAGKRAGGAAAACAAVPEKPAASTWQPVTGVTSTATPPARNSPPAARSTGSLSAEAAARLLLASTTVKRRGGQQHRRFACDLPAEHRRADGAFVKYQQYPLRINILLFKTAFPADIIILKTEPTVKDINKIQNY